MKILLLDNFTKIPYHEGYMVSKDGRVISLKYGKIRELKQWINSNGYLTTKIDNKHYPLHRILAHTFLLKILEEFNLTVNHKDCNKLNNSLDNLEFLSITDNVLHAKRNGIGTLQEIPVIGTKVNLPNLQFSYSSQAEAARHTGTKQSNINKCIMGQRKTAGGFA